MGAPSRLACGGAWARVAVLCGALAASSPGAASPLAASPPAAAVPPAAGERMEAGPSELEDVGIDEHLGAQVPLQLAFTESDGRHVTLGQIITARRPAILTLNYSSCPMLCSLQLDAFVAGLRELDWTLGEQFDVITLSVDPHEAPERTRQFKDKYLAQYQREPAAAGWHFLTGSEENIATVARTVGFKFKFLPETREYAHAAALMLLSPEGTVSRYLYGVHYTARDLRFGLVEAAEGRVGSTVDRILLYCFHYDAAAGRYAPVAANIMRLGGAITVILLGGILGTLWLRDSRKQRLPLR